MKLLFDQNLSYKLTQKLSDIFPLSNHVRLLNLSAADDLIVWKFAKENNYTIVTQDADFFDISILRDSPPQIIWIRSGNISTKRVEEIIRSNHLAIRYFIENSKNNCLELF